MNISNTKSLRLINCDKVISVLMEKRECTKNYLALATGLSLATITNILKDLLASNEVIKGGELESTGGRKSTVYSLNSEYSRTLNIIINKQYHRVYIIYRVYNLLDEVIYQDDVIKKEIKIDDIYDIINIVINSFDNIKVIGISVPGIINDDKITSTGLNEFNNIDLYTLLHNKYNQEIIIGNDVNTAVMGFYLTNKDYDDVCLLFQPGDGYGGVGTVLSGELIVGKSNCAGEIQYLPIDKEGQLKLLQTPDGTIELISKIISCLIAIVNPEVVGICCINLESIEDLYPLLKQLVPEKYFPKLTKIEDLSDYSFMGLQLLCKESLKRKTKIKKNCR